MIVIPRLLAEQLSAVDHELRRRLALDFAQHALDDHRDLFDARLPGDGGDAPLGSTAPLDAYLGAARAFVDGGGSIAEVESARRRFFGWYVGLSGLASDLAWTVNLAVLSACGPDLYEAFDYIVRSKHDASDTVHLAKEAQRMAGRRAATKEAEYAARWEEARWQLLRTIERLPNPHA
ncbi:hypothetical protein ACFOY2_28520 [Nonomuraea purpurea]|uniref:Uncharacterized protein n=1 Tax=Nonomuraea purpurea TaxID=1849276 RepID=A0ABV8GER0_9ACTN